MTRTIIPGGSDELTGWTLDGVPIDVTGRRWITRRDWRRWPMLGLPSPEAVLLVGGKGVEPEFE